MRDLARAYEARKVGAAPRPPSLHRRRVARPL